MAEPIESIIRKAFMGVELFTDPKADLLTTLQTICTMPIPQRDSNVTSGFRETEDIHILTENNMQILQETVSEILIELSGIRTIEDGQIGPKPLRMKYMKQMKKEGTKKTINEDQSGIPSNMLKVIFRLEEDESPEDEESNEATDTSRKTSNENTPVSDFESLKKAMKLSANRRQVHHQITIGHPPLIESSSSEDQTPIAKSCPKQPLNLMNESLV